MLEKSDDVPDAFQLEILNPEVCPHQSATPLANSFIIGTVSNKQQRYEVLQARFCTPF
jgi:hypothetical protein